MHLQSRYETIYFKHCRKDHTQQSTFFWCCICHNIIGPAPFLLLCSQDSWPDRLFPKTSQKYETKINKATVFTRSPMFSSTSESFFIFTTQILVSFFSHVRQLNRSSLQIIAQYICRRQQASNTSISQKVIGKQRLQVQLRRSIDYLVGMLCYAFHAHKYQ